MRALLYGLGYDAYDPRRDIDTYIYFLIGTLAVMTFMCMDFKKSVIKIKKSVESSSRVSVCRKLIFLIKILQNNGKHYVSDIVFKSFLFSMFELLVEYKVSFGILNLGLLKLF